MDWPDISVYDGGWFEWSKDPERNPVEVGLETIAA
jgi:thiosulfate/3-mercaptopyruvate sulfurtransferase